MRKLSRAQLIAALLGIFLLASLAFAMGAGGGLGLPTSGSGGTYGQAASGGLSSASPTGPDTPVSSDDGASARPTISSDPPPALGGIRNFDQCAAAGYPVAESYPEQCRTPDGRLFVRVVN